MKNDHGVANWSDEQKARLLLEFLAQPLGKLFHLFQSCVQVFGEEALPELLQI